MTILISYLVLDMTFTNEGNKTQFDELVNFEKMVSLTLFSLTIKDPPYRLNLRKSVYLNANCSGARQS